MILELLLAGDVANIVRQSFKKLGGKYFVEIDDLINGKVMSQFDSAISRGVKAFMSSLTTNVTLNKKQVGIISAFFKKDETVTEFSKLLDPGSEVFDDGALTTALHEVLLKENIDQITRARISEAWLAFEKAFSFSSRSYAELRDFLRASYEAGSFRAISNVQDTLERISQDLDFVILQEEMFGKNVMEYQVELGEYKKWAENQIQKMS